MRSLLLVIVCFLSACAGTPSASNSTPYASLSSTSVTGVSAADALLEKGNALLEADDFSGAANHFERGIRLAPKSAALYLALAKAQMSLNQYKQAEQMANRAVSLVPSNPNAAERQTKIEAYVLVARSRQQAGDQAGSKAAMMKAQSLW